MKVNTKNKCIKVLQTYGFEGVVTRMLRDIQTLSLNLLCQVGNSEQTVTEEHIAYVEVALEQLKAFYKMEEDEIDLYRHYLCDAGLKEWEKANEDMDKQSVRGRGSGRKNKRDSGQVHREGSDTEEQQPPVDDGGNKRKGRRRTKRPDGM